ncbi:unnamed protein product, partial [Mesorhabditis spiculigera]
MQSCTWILVASLALQLCSGQNHTRPRSTNLLLDLLKRNIDWNRDPCDNFYQHVCPLNATGPFALAYSLSPEIIDYIEKSTRPSPVEIALKRMVVNPNANETDLRDLRAAAAFVEGLRQHAGMLAYLRHELTPEELNQFSNYAPVVEDLIRVTVSQVEVRFVSSAYLIFT